MKENYNSNSTCLRGGFGLVSIMLVQSEQTAWSPTDIPYFHLAVCTLKEKLGNYLLFVFLFIRLNRMQSCIISQQQSTSRWNTRYKLRLGYFIHTSVCNQFFVLKVIFLLGINMLACNRISYTSLRATLCQLFSKSLAVQRDRGALIPVG